MFLGLLSVYMLFFVNGHGMIYVCVWYVIMNEYGAICVCEYCAEGCVYVCGIVCSEVCYVWDMVQFCVL